MADGINHVVKIVCGAGNNSKNGKAVLKFKIPEYLVSAIYY